MVAGFIIVVFTFLSAWLGHFVVLSILSRAGMAERVDVTGKWIGYMERVLVTIFVSLNFVTQTVFIFATKAAFMAYRMPKDGNEKQKAEYMMIGTMASYITGLVFGLVCQAILKKNLMEWVALLLSRSS